MEQRHWWKEDRYWHRGEACRNESDSPLFLEMIAEATRQGIQQGKREAWEELKEYCEEERSRCNRKMNEYEKDGKFGLQRQMDGEAVVHYTLARVLGDRLASLDNSSKEE